MLSGSGLMSSVGTRSEAKGVHGAIPFSWRDVSVSHALYSYEVSHLGEEATTVVK